MKVNSSSMSESLLQELVESFGQFIQTLGKAFFRLCQAFVEGSHDSDFLRDELLLHPFVLSREFLIHRLQNDGCLLRQQFLDLRNYGRLPFVSMCGC